VDGFNPTHRDGDNLGMVYGIAFTTLVFCFNGGSTSNICRYKWIEVINDGYMMMVDDSLNMKR